MQSVKRRHVLYIPGYDPFPARRYREMYRSEGQRQAAICGYKLQQEAVKDHKNFAWRVQYQDTDLTSEAVIEVLVWSDIVQRSMGRSIFETYRQLMHTSWTYIASGTLWRLIQLRRGPVIAALYPIVFLIFQAILAIGLAVWVYDLFATFFTFRFSNGLAALIALCVGYGVLHLFRRWDRTFLAYYLMHDYAYSAQFRGANPSELEDRLGAFRATLSEAMSRDVEEVLVVGHSSGAHLAVSILADYLRDQDTDTGALRPKLALLTLGHVVPMVSFLPDAHRLRRDLAYLSMETRLTWIDVSALGDGCAFALCDPVAVSGVAPKAKRWPLVISAAFSTTLSPERWNALKRRYYRLHFQYLHAFDRPKGYDYFQITAGPYTLAERFAKRKNSPSVITKPVNIYTDLSP